MFFKCIYVDSAKIAQILLGKRILMWSAFVNDYKILALASSLSSSHAFSLVLENLRVYIAMPWSIRL